MPDPFNDIYAPSRRILSTMFCKVHRAQDGTEVVALCDRELVNTTIMHGDLPIKISGFFYGTEERPEDEVVAILARAGNINIIGERSVKFALSHGVVDKEACVLLGTVPHAQVVRI